MPSLDLPDAADDALEYYKSQIRELEAELADFQMSSRELEQELEKELEASEKEHRDLRNKNEALRYEVDEWKSKYNKSKTEANAVQNTLQKEITTLREQNRSMQLRLRDMEVSNDDFERQGRIVMSSLEDLESKYNQSIERGVLMEEEFRIGEQEREALRIELQRVRDEMSDLKVEQEITADKLQNALAMAAKYGNGSLHHVPPPQYQSPLSDTSTVLSDEPCTPMMTPSIASTTTPQSDHSGPPSPPMSEVSTTPSQSSRITTPLDDPASTPRPRNIPKTRHSRGGSLGGGSTLPLPLPSSRSLHQIRGLIGQMQRLEQRVHSARSKLPGPTAVSTPPLRVSPRTSQVSTPINISTVTLRSQKKSRTPSTTSSVASGDQFPGRLSFPAMDRPTSRMARPDSRASGTLSRPDSRASRTSGSTSRSSVSGGIDRPSSLPQRPQSKANGMAGRMTPMGTRGEYETPTTSRERKSMGGEEVGFGLGPRRNTLGGSALPLPRKSFGGRASVAGTRGFEENGLGYSANGGGRRPLTKSPMKIPVKRMGEK